MTSAALSWLPDSALIDVRTADPVARCVLNWSDAWLQADRLSPTPRWERHQANGAIGSFSPCATGRGFRLMIRDNGRRTLASLMLGYEIGERSLRTAADHSVIDEVTTRAIDDLARMLGEILTSKNAQPLPELLDPDASQSLDVFSLPLSNGAGPALLVIEAIRPAVASLAASWAGTTRKGDPLDPRQDALAEQPLRLSGHVGTTRLPLPEIEQLGVGDVLLLEHEVGAPISACIEGQSVGDTALTIIPGDTEFAFKIERPATQW